MTEPEGDDPPVSEGPLTPEPPETVPSGPRLRALPALAIASILIAAGLLMAVSGMVRLVGPAPPTPTPTVVASGSPTLAP